MVRSGNKGDKRRMQDTPICFKILGVATDAGWESRRSGKEALEDFKVIIVVLKIEWLNPFLPRMVAMASSFQRYTSFFLFT